jgi:hypothetical protein
MPFFGARVGYNLSVSDGVTHLARVRNSSEVREFCCMDLHLFVERRRLARSALKSACPKAERAPESPL